MTTSACHYGDEHAPIRVVLVHGFGGHPQKTWGKFPKLLEEDPDLPALCIRSWGYLSGLLRRCPGIERVAEQLSTFLCIGQGKPDHIILVGHSIGGLMLLQSLVTQLLQDQARRYPVNKIDRIALFATPLAGDLVQRVIRRLITCPMGFLARHVWRNRQLIDLYNIEVVSRLGSHVVNRIYRPESGSASDSRRKIAIHAFVADGDRVVTETSVRAWFEQPPPRLIPNTNHNTIKLPDSRKAAAYEALRDVIDEVVHPWFQKLVKLATHIRSPHRDTAFNDLMHAYQRAVDARLRAARGPRWSTNSAKEAERKKFFSIVLKEATLRPSAPIARVFNHAMKAYRCTRTMAPRAKT